jgi:hypothetical protein
MPSPGGNAPAVTANVIAVSEPAAVTAWLYAVPRVAPASDTGETVIVGGCTVIE